MTSLLMAAALLQNKAIVFTFVSDKTVNRVNLAGTFNNWSKDATPLVLGSDKKTWTVSLELPAGKHQYKFVVDGETWMTDPTAKTAEDGNGNTNSLLVVFPEGYEVPARKKDGTITLAAVSHPRELPFLNWDRGVLYLTVKTRASDVEQVSAFFKSAGKGPNGITALMESSGDEFTTSWTCKMPWDCKSPVTYWFSLQDGQRSVWTLDSRGARVADETSVPFRLDPKTYKPFMPPSWVEETVVYQIFPDRFANGDKSNDPQDVQPWDGTPTYSNWFGGDLAGVGQHIDHLKDLDVSCIYYNPIFEGPSNHHYETTDYLSVDHRLGTNQEFADLTATLHKNGIRTILDGVFNHTSVDFFAFSDILKNQQASKFLDWYTVNAFPVKVGERPNYEAWFGFQSMPKLKNATPAVRDYLLRVPDYWAKTAKIDGWRLDVANEVPGDYWKQFRDRVKGHGNDQWIVGEIWGDGSPWLKGDQFDSVMNYQFREAVLGFVARGTTSPGWFWHRLMQVYESYGPQVSRNMMNLLGSHDTARILTECGGDGRLARLAAMIQFTWVGSPCVYYGDELGMVGGRDPDNRRGMEWGKAKPDNPFLVLYKHLARLREEIPSLQSGEPSKLGDDDKRGLLVFRRQLGGKWAVVAVNRSESPREVYVPSLVPLTVDSFENTVDKVLPSHTTVRPMDGTVQTSVPPMSIAVLRPEKP